MKKFLTFILILLFTVSFFGCSEVDTNDGKLDIVCTVFPIYDWAKNITDGIEEPNLLLDNGVDLHSFQPDVDDMITISTCDVFIFIGGESDTWVKDALKNSVNKDMLVINLMDVLGEDVFEEEETEGMQSEECEEEETEYDEHIWLSLGNAEKLCKVIAEKIAEKDSENSEKYLSNAEKYISELSALKNEYLEVAEKATCKTLLFADRFPFRYLTEELNLNYFAAFSGCSAETEASFETIATLSDKVDALGLKYILITETSDGKIADTIIQNTNEKNAEVLVLDSMQSKTVKDISEGKTYLSVAKSNLEILKKALIGE